MVADKGVYYLARHQYDVAPPLKGVCPLAVVLGRGHCEVLRCSNVEHRCRNASSAADVWKARKVHGTQTFASKTQRQPGSCPTDRTRW